MKHIFICRFFGAFSIGKIAFFSSRSVFFAAVVVAFASSLVFCCRSTQKLIRFLIIFSFLPMLCKPWPAVHSLVVDSFVFGKQYKMHILSFIITIFLFSSSSSSSLLLWMSFKHHAINQYKTVANKPVPTLIDEHWRQTTMQSTKTTYNVDKLSK